MIYLLDTNVCVRYLCGRKPRVLHRLANTPISEVFLCSVVKSELFLGAMRSAGPAANRAKVVAFVRPFESLSFDDAAAEIQANIRHQLESAGTPIGPYDLQIAAIALSNNLTLVTHNSGEFSRVPGLAIEDCETT